MKKQTWSFLLVIGFAFLITLALWSEAQSTSAEIPEVTAPATANTWTSYRHDSGRTGYNPDETILGPPLTLYDRIPPADSDAALFNNLLVDGRRIYVQNLFSIWAFDQDSHELLWRFDDCYDPTAFCTLRGFAAVYADRVILVKQFLLESRSDLVLLNSATGQVEHTLSITNSPLPVFTLYGNRIWLLWHHDDGYKLVSLSPYNLDPLSTTYTNDYSGSFANGGPAAAGGRIFFAHGNEIIAFSISQNTEEWRVTDPGMAGPLDYDLVALDDALLVAQGERVFALDPNDSGAELWNKPAETCPIGYNATNNIIATDGTHVTVSGLCNQDVITYQLSDGTELWRKSIGPFNPPTAMASANGVLYIAALPTFSEYYLYLYDQADGTLLQQLPLDPEDITNVLAISQEFLYTAGAIGDTVQIFERTPADLRAGITEETLPFCGAMVGGSLSYEFTVVNDGPGQADDIEAALSLPPSTKTISTTAGICTGGDSPVCSLGTLMMGEAVTITVQATPTVTGTHTVGLSLSSNPRDPLEDNNSVSKTVQVAAAAGADLIATDMEVTQGIQTMLNTVPLLAGKATAVRAYIQTDGPQVDNVTAILHGAESPSGDPLPGSPLSPVDGFGCVTVDGNGPDRTVITETVLFELPDNWLTGNIDLQVEVNPTGAISDSVPINNTFAVPVAYEEAAPVCIRTYRVRTAGPLPSGGVSFSLSPPSSYLVADPDGIISRTLSLLPTSEIIIFPESQLLEEWEPSLFTDDDYGPYEFNENDKDDIKVMTTLWWHNVMTDSPAECIAAGARTHYLGMIHENTIGSDGVFNGKGNYDGAVSIVRLRTNNDGAFDDPPGGTSLAHELGHNYDRRHVPNAATCGSEPNDPWYSPWLVAETDVNYPYNTCTLDDGPLDDPGTHFGFDLLTRAVVDPSQTGDLMSYASSRWTSDYTWDAFLQRFQAGAASAAASVEDTQATPLPASDILLVSGEVLSTTIRLDGLLRVPDSFIPVSNQGELLDPGAPSSYSLELLDVADTPLVTKTLSLQPSVGLSTSELWFNTGVSFVPGTAKIRVSLDGAPIVTQTISANAPEVTVLSPNLGDIVTDTLMISWEASDADPDTELVYIVQYSNDQGNTWRVLASSVLTDHLAVDSSLLPGSLDESLVRVIASDGINSGSDQSALFTVALRDPLVFIQGPSEGAVFGIGQPVTLRGVGYDPEDGSIAQDELNWAVSGLGAVGTGKKLVLTDLPKGEYTITLSTTDSDGQMSSQAVNVEVTNTQSVYLPLITR